MAIIKYPNYQINFYDQLSNEVNNLFNEFFGSNYSSLASNFEHAGYPPVNISEDIDNLYLTAELPGIKSKDIEINVEKDNIQIKGERKIEKETKDAHYHRCERESGSFYKKIKLPIQIENEKVEASLENGVLKITMPKSGEAKPKKIEVKVG